MCYELYGITTKQLNNILKEVKKENGCKTCATKGYIEVDTEFEGLNNERKICSSCGGNGVELRALQSIKINNMDLDFILHKDINGIILNKSIIKLSKEDLYTLVK